MKASKQLLDEPDERFVLSTSTANCLHLVKQLNRH